MTDFTGAYIDETVVGQIIAPMLTDPQVVGWMGTIETGLAIASAMLTALKRKLRPAEICAKRPKSAEITVAILG